MSELYSNLNIFLSPDHGFLRVNETQRFTETVEMQQLSIVYVANFLTEVVTHMNFDYF